MYKTRSKFLQRSRGTSMYETRSKFLQRPGTGKRRPPSLKSAKSAEKANERRAPFFYRVKKMETGIDFPRDFPPWLRSEIRGSGGPKSWIRRNAYWQKRLRRQYVSIIAKETSQRNLEKILPKWLFEEVKSFSRLRWLRMHSVQTRPNPRRSVVRHPIESPSANSVTASEDRYRKLQANITAGTSISWQKWRLVEIEGRAERIDIHGQCLRCCGSSRPIWYYSKSTVGAIFVCSPCHDQLLSGSTGREDALDHTVSGGAFDTNRRRH